MPKFLFKNQMPFYSADGAGAGAGAQTQTPGTSGDSARTYTQEEVHELLNSNSFAQSEIDRRVQQAVSTATKKKEKEFDETLTTKRNEWEEEARMKEAGVDLSGDDQMKALQKKIYDLERTALVSKSESILAQKNLPTSFKEYVTKDTPEATEQAIASLEQVMSEYISGIKKDSLRGSTPRVSTETKAPTKTAGRITDINDEAELNRRYGHLKK